MSLWRNVVAVISLVLMILAACGERTVTRDQEGGGDLGRSTIKLGHMAWTDCETMANVARVVLQNEGYEVELVSADAGVIYQSLADGQVDAMLCSWQPITHKDYVEKFQDNIEQAGINMEGARLGWVVPTYVEINSIEELKGNADQFGGQIVGIDPGAGLMRLSKEAMRAYGLEGEYRLVTSSDATMTAALGDAIQSNQPIVVTGWKPHIMWAKFDVKWLEDPEGALGSGEQVMTMVHKGLREEAPRAYEILSQIKIEPDTLSELMLQVVEGGNAEEVARNFVENNQDIVNTWTAQQR